MLFLLTGTEKSLSLCSCVDSCVETVFDGSGGDTDDSIVVGWEGGKSGDEIEEGRIDRNTRIQRAIIEAIEMIVNCDEDIIFKKNTTTFGVSFEF